MTNEQAMAYLMRDGNLATPGTRYGRNTAECAPVAVAAARIYAEAQGEPLTPDALDYMMGLVVNGYDDPEYLISNYGDADAVGSDPS